MDHSSLFNTTKLRVHDTRADHVVNMVSSVYVFPVILDYIV